MRPFKSDDLDPVVDLWNQCLPLDLISIDRFWRIFLLDPNFQRDGAIVAEQNGQIIGYVQAMASKAGVGPKPGYLTTFFVDPAFRRMGLGTSLITAGLDFLKRQGCVRVTSNGYGPFYAFPGIDHRYVEALRFMESAGFSPAAEPVAMELDLRNAAVPHAVQRRRQELSDEGFEVRMYTRSDTLPLLAFADNHFPFWKQGLIEGLQAGNHDIVLAAKDGEVVGYTQWQNTQTDPPHGAPGRFGPFGVHPELRGKGIGAAIFYQTVELAISQGQARLWFGWAGGRNLSFYERAGCSVSRRFRMFGIDF